MKKIILILCIFSFQSLYSVEVIWHKNIHSEQVIDLFNQHNKFLYSIGSGRKIYKIDLKTGEKIDSILLNFSPKKMFIDYKNDILFTGIKNKSYAGIITHSLSSFDSIRTIDLEYLLNDTIPLRDQEIIENNVITFDETIISGLGIYNYIQADHFYYGRLAIIEPDTQLIYQGGMITNLTLSPNREHIAFTTLYRSSEYQAPYVYRELEITELILTDKNFEELKVLRKDSIQDFEYVDSEIFNSIKFSPDSKKLLAATDEHHLFVYDVYNGSMTDSIYSCDCYGDQAVDWYYDNHHIISCTNNGKVKIWNIDYDIIVDSYEFSNSPYLVAISASKDSNFISIGDHEGNITLLQTTDVFPTVRENNVKSFIVLNGNNIHLNVNNNKSLVEIYNLSGSLIFQKIYTNNADIRTDFLTHGVYFIVVKSGSQTQTIKFIVI